MSETHAQSRSRWRTVQWWPSAAGIAFAAYVASDLFIGTESGSDLAAIVAASGLVYLAAAAISSPVSAWPAFLVSVVVITASRLGWVPVEPTWLLLGLAVLLIAYGVLRGAMSHAGLPSQTLAMLGFGAVAASALFVNEVAGAYLVAAGLFAHAGWDAYHHWTNKVVVRSLAEFCLVLDVALALAIIIAINRG